ncbi:hypothetical protein [Nostoc sp.]|uniref:hypothetical protein n=1 Tax=Nostoc sp. TaxID=1180 RepID=UPI002FF9AED8
MAPSFQWYSIVDGGAVDFFRGYGINAVNAIAQGIPKITVVAIFQNRSPMFHRSSQHSN